MHEAPHPHLRPAEIAAHSRRAIVAALTGAATWLGCAAADARSRRNKRRKKRRQPPLRRNAFGCVDAGGACRGKDDVCCSGICDGPSPRKGKADRSRCVPHDALTCEPADDSCVKEVVCGDNGNCFRTTGSASFCGTQDLKCVSCKQDTDCELLFGAGAACIVCAACDQFDGTTCRSAAAAS